MIHSQQFQSLKRRLQSANYSVDRLVPYARNMTSGRGSEQTRVHVHKTLHGNRMRSIQNSVYSVETQEAADLAEKMLECTRSLMNGSNEHIIAYSGGIDSSVVAALVFNAASSHEIAKAVLGVSPAVPSDQIALAEQVADVIGIHLEQIPTTEGGDATYIENSGQACLACKTHLYTCLESIAEHADGKRLYNGTNADDLKDPTRLGLIAADRFNVRSPLRNVTKEEVRIVGKYFGLPNWNYAASPCLRSRLAIGVQALPEHLKRIEDAENYIRECLSLDATHNLRVRLLSKNRAMVEVEDQFLGTAKSCIDDWQIYFKNVLQFESVDVRRFKTGSVAKVVGSGHPSEVAVSAV